VSEDEALFTELRRSKGIIDHEGYDADDIEDAIELITKLRRQLADAPHNPFCTFSPHSPDLLCSCWKAGL